MYDQSLKRLAYHEAGHAVAALYNESIGYKVMSAYVSLELNELGHIHGKVTTTIPSYVNKFGVTPVCQSSALLLAYNGIAGDLLCSMLCGYRVDGQVCVGNDDIEWALGFSPYHNIKQEINRARDFVSKRWSIVRKIAEHLLKNRNIDALEMEQYRKMVL